jgi:hypothetical protein
MKKIEEVGVPNGIATFSQDVLLKRLVGEEMVEAVESGTESMEPS